MAPPQTAYEITGKLTGDLAGRAQPEIAAPVRQNGCEPVGMGPEAMARFVEAETNEWSRVLNIKGFRSDQGWNTHGVCSCALRCRSSGQRPSLALRWPPIRLRQTFPLDRCD
ncbi:MAG: hypothetical protein JO230_26540 [Xanthobacteraceae bacterium]|nr:hypothetical protein [Xanthobacteraceae bacterium]